MAGLAFIGSGSAAVVTRAESTTLLPVPSEPFIDGGRAFPTLAWSEFCEKAPAECAVEISESETITLTEVVWDLINSVNKQVNAAIMPIPDPEHWNVEDRWDYPEDGKGDCEDIQLLKRKLLADKGLPHRAMRMTVVIDDLGDGHAVLMVRTDRGDFILDNKRDEVLSWKQTGSSS